MDALDYEKLLHLLIRLEGDRLRPARPAHRACGRRARPSLRNSKKGGPPLGALTRFANECSFDMAFTGEVRGVLAMQPTVVNAQPDCWGVCDDGNHLPVTLAVTQTPVRSRPTL